MKNALVITAILGTILLSTSCYSQEPESAEAGQITELIKILARLTDMGEACGEHLNYFGKKAALEGAYCREFSQVFYENWPSREALLQTIADYKLRLDQGQYVCERCQFMLERAEELRITVTYYLDYIDFMKEL